MKAFVEDFGVIVRQLREGQGWSQEQLAERPDLNRSYVGEIERGRVVPSIVTAQKIAVALGISIVNLLARCEQLEQSRLARRINLAAIACWGVTTPQGLDPCIEVGLEGVQSKPCAWLQISGKAVPASDAFRGCVLRRATSARYALSLSITQLVFACSSLRFLLPVLLPSAKSASLVMCS